MSKQSHTFKDKQGKEWYFELWWGWQNQSHEQVVFFWDEPKAITGLLKFTSDKALHYSKLKQRMSKVAKDPEYRNKHLTELKFPLARYYQL